MKALETSTKTDLQQRLATIAPGISIETIWEHDEDGAFNRNEEWTNGEDPDDWQCWQSEVRASAIVNGELVYGSAYMGGTWEKYGDNPHQSNPEISGYEPQMTVEALEELAKLAPATKRQVLEAIQAIRKETV